MQTETNGSQEVKKPDYFKEFCTNGMWHGCLIAGTLGLGFVFGNILGLIVGVALYIVGLLNLHSLPAFRKGVDAEFNAAIEEEQRVRIAEFDSKRSRMYNALSDELADCYNMLKNQLIYIAKAFPNTLFRTEEIAWGVFRQLVFLHNKKSNLISDDELIAKINSLTYQIGVEEKKLHDMVGVETESIIKSQRILLNSKKDALSILQDKKAAIDSIQNDIRSVEAMIETIKEQLKVALMLTSSANKEASIAELLGTIAERVCLPEYMSEFPRFGKEVGMGGESYVQPVREDLVKPRSKAPVFSDDQSLSDEILAGFNKDGRTMILNRSPVTARRGSKTKQNQFGG